MLSQPGPIRHAAGGTRFPTRIFLSTHTVNDILGRAFLLYFLPSRQKLSPTRRPPTPILIADIHSDVHSTCHSVATIPDTIELALKPMLLLHLTDIHFRTPDCVTPDSDPDRPYRTRMLQDIRGRLAGLGSVSAVFVGGDIAFHGDPLEYQTALAWLHEVARECGCSMERVFVVPGNHDVDRRVIRTSAAVRNARGAIIQARDDRRERELRTQLDDPETCQSLMAPLHAYNDFAKLFNCQLCPPTRLSWRQDLPLDAAATLRVHGLTSPLLSGTHGQDDTPGHLYLSPLQTVLDPAENIVNLVLCHHPPHWLLDRDAVNQAIRGRAAIHLFGHEHRAQVSTGASYLSLTAGAVNPNRYQEGWRPSYGLIQTRLLGSDHRRTLELQVHVLQWAIHPERYVPFPTVHGDPVHRHSIPLFAVAASSTLTPLGVSRATRQAAAAAEVAMSTTDTRNLVFRFWGLTVSQRREIAQCLQLITDDELSLPESQRYWRALHRASERGILEQVAEAVAQRETR